MDIKIYSDPVTYNGDPVGSYTRYLLITADAPAPTDIQD